MDIEQFCIKVNSDKTRDVKGAGQVYTPHHIATHLISVIEPTYDDVVVEPSVGSGSIAFSLFYYLIQNFGVDGFTEWFNNKFYAFDIDAENIQIFEKYFTIFCDEFNITGFKFDRIILEDTLSNQDLIPDGAKFLANPPYIRFQNLEDSYRRFLQENFETCESGNVDIYYAFVEMICKKGGRSAVICPNSFIKNKSGAKLSKLVSDHAFYFNDFKDEKVFDGVGTYTAIIGLNFDTQGTLWSDSGPIDGFITNNDPQNDLTVLGGIATNADSVFLISEDNITRIDSEFVYLTGTKTVSGIIFDLSDKKLEVRACAKFYKLTKFDQKIICVCPYDGEWEILPEQEIPETISYLEMFKNILEKRDRGIKKYDAWYAFARRQGFHKIDGEVAIVPGMVGGECRPFIKTLDREHFDKICFSSGFVVMGEKINKLISSEFIEHLRKVGKPFSGGWVNISKANIRSFNV